MTTLLGGALQNGSRLCNLATQEIGHQLRERHFSAVGMGLCGSNELIPESQIHSGLREGGSSSSAAFHTPQIHHL